MHMLIVLMLIVHVISFDYSKAFDTITHGTVAEAIAKIEMPDSIYNRIIDYLDNRTHYTKFQNCASKRAAITAGVVQGSVLGPTLFNIATINHIKATFKNQ